MLESPKEKETTKEKRNTGRKVEFPVSEIVKDRAKSKVPFLYVQGIWLYPLPDLWRFGHIS